MSEVPRLMSASRSSLGYVNAVMVRSPYQDACNDQQGECNWTMGHRVAHLQLPPKRRQQERGEPGALLVHEKGQRNEKRREKCRPRAGQADKRSDTANPLVDPRGVEYGYNAGDLISRQFALFSQRLDVENCPCQAEAADGVERRVIDQEDKGRNA